MKRPYTYELRVPLAPDHWIWITSNKEMTVEHFRRLHSYLALQREILIEDDSAVAESQIADHPPLSNRIPSHEQ